ncbi:MAG: hypothetical protein QM831_36990 [Kofleriaceae bacterium]
MQPWHYYLLQFVAGMLLFNAIPHLAAGMMGQPFQSPFAKPSGIGESSPTLNVWWGFANLAGGIALVHTFLTADALGWLTLSAGALLIGTFCSNHFHKVRHATRT